jgi:hypothetical protein
VGADSKKLAYEKLNVFRGKRSRKRAVRRGTYPFIYKTKCFRFLSALSSPKTTRYLVLGKQHTVGCCVAKVALPQDLKDVKDYSVTGTDQKANFGRINMLNNSRPIV